MGKISIEDCEEAIQLYTEELIKREKLLYKGIKLNQDKLYTNKMNQNFIDSTKLDIKRWEQRKYILINKETMQHKYEGHKVEELGHEGKTAFLIQDTTESGYTGFYKEDPRAVGQGKTVEETLSNLSVAFKAMEDWEKETNK